MRTAVEMPSAGRKLPPFLRDEGFSVGLTGQAIAKGTGFARFNPLQPA